MPAIQTTDTAIPASWSLPPLGNLDAYRSAVHNMPMLTLEEETIYSRALRDNDDLNAAGKLVMSHLRLVTSIAKQFQGYGLPDADLIQEGNVGLMKAVRRFDPDHGVRLVSYAMHWIKSQIHEFVIKNWRIVKMATTKAQRKLFFNLRSKKTALRAADDDFHDRPAPLSSAEVQTMADELNVKPQEVREMEARLSGGDVALEADDSDEDSPRAGALAFLSDPEQSPDAILERKERDRLTTVGVSQALEGLDERSRRIVTERWINVNDDGSCTTTLLDLATEYGVSAERIRQLEAKALRKMREVLSRFQLDAQPA